jgi:hypothetical protein
MELSIFPINANMILGFLSFSSLDGTTKLKYNHSQMLASYSFNSSAFDFFFRVWNLYTLWHMLKKKFDVQAIREKSLLNL